MPRRILSIITALALCLSLCPPQARADVSPAYSTVYIGGTTVTDEASTTTIAAGEGTAVWDPASAVLTLENATFSDYISINAVDYSRTIKVILKGRNRIDISSSKESLAAALRTVCSLEIEEEDSAALEITTNPEQNYGQNAIIANHNLRIKSGTFNLCSGGQTIYGGLDAGTGVEIQGGNITAESPSAAIYSDHDIQIGGGALVTAKSTGSNAVYSAGNVQISNSELDVSTTGGYPAIYGAALVDIQGGSITATCANANAIYSDGTVRITNSQLSATGLYLAICGIAAVDIQGGSITATSTNSSAIYSDSSIQIQQDAEVTATGYECAILTPGELNISESKVKGHSDANHVIYTTAPITIENSELTLTSDVYTSGIFLNANSPLTISGCTNVNVTTAGSAIVSNGDVSITDSRLTISSEGNGIVAAVEADNGGGTLSISGTTHIESQSEYPLTGYKVEMTGGYVKSVTSDGPAISATNGITVSGGEVYAESNGSRPTMKPAGLYSRKGEINLTGESTKVQAVSANYRAIYNEEGTISLNANVIAEAGTYDPAFMACSVTNDTSADPTHNITIGEGFSSQGNRPVTTAWKNETLITGYSHYAYTVLAPVGTANLQDDYLDTPNQITIAACLHPDGQCAYAHIAGTATHVRTCLDCGKVWASEPCNYTFSDATGTCAACGDSLTVAVSGTENPVYDGTEKTPGVTVMRGETALTAGADYSVAYTDNTNAGTATVAVTIGSNQGNYTGNFTIGKATLSIKASDQTITYGGSIATSTDRVTATGLASGDTLESVTLEASTSNVPGGTITPSSAVIKRGGEDVTANYNITYVPGDLTINPSPVTLTFNNQTITYGDAPTGATANPASADIKYSYITSAGGEPISGWPTNAGTYTVTAKVEATGNYGEATATAQLTINKAPLTITGATAASKPYDETTTATVEAVTFDGLKNGETLALGTDYTATGTFADANAGEGKSVTVTVTLTSDKANNYNLTPNTTTATADITKASSSIITAPTASGITYGQALSDSNLTGGEGSVAGAFSWTAPATKPNAGTTQFEVTFTPDDQDYNTAKVNVSVTVAKATPTVTWTNAAQTLDYTGSEAAITPPTVTLVNGESFSDTISYSYAPSGSTSYTSGLPVNAGTYTVKASIGEQSNYIAAESAEMTLTISKINYTGTITASTSGKYGREKTYDLSDLLPDGYKLGTPTKTDTNNIFGGDPILNGAALTYKLADNAGVGKTGTITVPVTESTNYNTFDLTITVTVTDKIVPTLTVTPISVPYTGSAVPAGAIHGTATADGKNIPGSWSFADGQALTNVADSGTKTVNFTPADEFKDDYAPATGTVRVTIAKATPSLSLTPSPATLPNGGTVTLALSGLPSGGSATVTCSDENITVTKGSGDTWTAELPAGGASYTFTASYSGDSNHNGASANCTVSVEKITPALSLTANPSSQRGGGTVTLTLSGLPTGGTAAVTCSGGITVTAGAGSTWTATLPNSTATYTFTASYAGNASYNAASASCTVETTEVTILPDPPEAGDGKQYQVIMEDGISEVPAGLQSIETLNTPEKLETAMKTAITQANSGVPQANTAVYDVELQISTDGGTTWTKATAANFPANGLTVTLPYPAGTNSSYTFTVVHMFTTSDFGKTPGDIETPRVINTASGLQFTVTGLSPVSVGWTAPATTPDTPSGGNHGGGGGGSVSTYAITVEKSEHGKVTSNRTNASNGSTVTLTVTPDSGYVLDALTVTDSRGNEIKLTAQGGNKYTFTMPSRAVTVKASFVPLPDDTQKPCDGGADCPSRSFTDLGSVGTWYHEAVDYVLRNGLMGGYGNGTFGPNNNLTRAQFAQILFNKEGRPVVNYLLQYGDVAEGAWYTEAIRWATSQGIVGGYGNGMFGPNDNITREQLAVMLWRYAGSPAATNKELHFNDADEASGYALEALRWAVENGVMSGKGGGSLDPKGLATRAEAAQMLKNLIGR